MERFKSLPYQREVFEASKHLACAAYFLDPGLGKSKITIDVACDMRTNNKIQAAMVVSLGRVAENWATEEIIKHGWSTFEHDIFPWRRGDRQRSRLFFEALERSPASSRMWWFTLNKEALLNKELVAAIRKFMKRVPTMLILDESTFIKSPAAKITRVCHILGEHARVRRILTGTPVPNSPLDIYPQYRFLHKDLLPVSTKQGFVEQFCQTKKIYLPGGRSISAATVLKQDALAPFVSDVTFRLRKSDVLKDLPEKWHQEHKITMAGEERAIYDQLRETLIADLTQLFEERGQIVAVNAISAIVRLQQLLSGLAVTEGGLTVFESTKMIALKQFLDEMNRPMIVWCRFRKTIERLSNHLKETGKTVVELRGGLRPHEAEASKLAFQKGDAQFLIAHPQTAGWGLTFTQCSDMVFAENSFNWEHRIQAEDRIHRIGQESSRCIYNDFTVVNSIDEKILHNLLIKASINDTLKLSDVRGIL